MAFNDKLAERVRSSLSRKRDLEEKKMFGGLCFMWRGNMLCGVAQDDLLIRVADDRYKRLEKSEHIRPMMMKGKKFGTYLFIGSPAVDNTRNLNRYLGYSIEYVGKLPKKK